MWSCVQKYWWRNLPHGQNCKPVGECDQFLVERSRIILHWSLWLSSQRYMNILKVYSQMHFVKLFLVAFLRYTVKKGNVNVINSHRSCKQEFTTYNTMYLTDLQSTVILVHRFLSLYLICNLAFVLLLCYMLKLFQCLVQLQSPSSGWMTQKENITWYVTLALTLRVEVWDVVLSNEQGTTKGIDTNWVKSGLISFSS
jgi:hypothetical protein